MIEFNSTECNSLKSTEHNAMGKSNLNSQEFRLNKIREIEDYFITDMKESELMSKKLSKYIYIYFLLF